ncbi:class I SAM-dependent methyltransferase [Paracoccus sp. MC1854]|uniref:class I SAM-dependent methyltransferase n=1 Tax=Paracoccus sp. MC1854 TaxID=2760306 RepID=UPI0015FF81B5|nr:class I SAM-dependent methyltransferase [Paracoccus sp. MC1854]MBB1493047.1 class I SAM-dependent methyltransferase [Paracoccus sp. MC1854]
MTRSARRDDPAALPAGQTDAVSVLTDALQAVGARDILDLGCGEGGIARALSRRGFRVTGVEPSPEAAARAAQRAPSARFLCARAEDLPAGLAGFDAAIFVNSLHHIPGKAMPAALLQAAATLRPGGRLVVIEPLGQGSFFRIMQPVEDETRIRAAARQAIERLIRERRLILREMRRWAQESRFAGLDDFVGYLARMMPKRAEIAARNHAALARAWRDNIRSRDGMAVLTQPMICWNLSAPAKPAVPQPA